MFLKKNREEEFALAEAQRAVETHKEAQAEIANANGSTPLLAKAVKRALPVIRETVSGLFPEVMKPSSTS